MIKTFCENPILILEFNKLPTSSNLEIAIADDKNLEVCPRALVRTV